MEIGTLIVDLISNVGFPIAVTFYLLYRFENKIDTLTSNLVKLTDIVSKHYEW